MQMIRQVDQMILNLQGDLTRHPESVEARQMISQLKQERIELVQSIESFISPEMWNAALKSVL